MQSENKKSLLKKIGSNIKNLREERSITVKEMAAALKITTQQYGNIESGKSSSDICRLVEIADYLKVALTELLGLEMANTYNNTVNAQANGSVIQGNNTVNHFVEKEYLEFLKTENAYLKEKLDGLLAKVAPAKK
jgi:transcriptional regulator with XRE-family HTH domain